MTIDSNDVTFLQAGTGAVTRTARAKLRDTVSVKDFGAVGDGSFEAMGSKFIYVEQSTDGYFAPAQIEGGRSGVYVTDHVRANSVTVDFAGLRLSGPHPTFVNYPSVEVALGGAYDFANRSRRRTSSSTSRPSPPARPRSGCSTRWAGERSSSASSTSAARRRRSRRPTGRW